MNLDQAIELALDINASSHATLISVGRYIASDQIASDSPWGCCVLLAASDKPIIVWSLLEFTSLFASPSPPDPIPIGEPHPDTLAPLAPGLRGEGSGVRGLEPQPRRDAEHLRQPTLF